MGKRFLLSGYFGFKNFGDEAILAVLVNKLRESNGQITIISSNPDYTKSLYKDVESVYTFNLKDIILSVLNTDILISGGGSLLQDTTSIKSLIYYSFVIFLGLFFRKRVIIFAQGIGPINSILGQFLTKTLLKHCSYISVRDVKSQNLLNGWGIHCELVCDPVFSTMIPTIDKDKILAVQLRNCKEINSDFIGRLAGCVCKKFSDYKVEIFSFQDEIDLEICKEFEKNLNMLNSEIQTTIYSGLTNSEIIKKISKAQYLISMRFHAIIIGLLANVKILCINYDIKVEKLAKEFNLPVIDLKNSILKGFQCLINIDTTETNKRVSNVKFNWKGFDNAIE